MISPIGLSRNAARSTLAWLLLSACSVSPSPDRVTGGDGVPRGSDTEPAPVDSASPPVEGPAHAAPVHVTAVPFNCSESLLFVSQGAPTALDAFSFGPGAGTFTEIGSTASTTYNALGYNPVDNFLYASSRTLSGDQHLLRIDSTGTVFDMGAFPNPPADALTAGFLAGAFDESAGDSGAGTYYATNPAGAGSSELYVYPLGNPTAATTITMTTNGAAVTPALYDWTFSQGYLWGVDHSGGRISRIDPTTGDVTNITQNLVPDATTETYGAAWTYGNGNLGFGNNVTGVVYQLAITNPSGATPTFTLVSVTGGPASNNNDGAACIGTSVDLSIAKTGPSTVLPGASITYTLTVTNQGPGVSSGFVAADSVPADITGVASTTPGCVVTGNSVACTEGTLAVGATFVATITGTAPSTLEEETNTATVTGDEYDPASANNTSSLGTSICQPLTQCAGGTNCGSASDGCGGMVTCGGGCSPPQTCGGGNPGTPNVCGCTPAMSCPTGYDCGTAPDGCGGEIGCGTCGAPQTCGGGTPANPNQCGCTPATTCPEGDDCGTAPDGCGGSVLCGGCSAPDTCGGGTPSNSNQCGCTPALMCPAGDECGTAPDGCGGMVQCGICEGANLACQNNQCVVVPVPFNCASSSFFVSQGAPTALEACTFGAGSAQFTAIGPTFTGSYNALGYNSVDNLLYASSRSLAGSQHLLQIDSTGTVFDQGPFPNAPADGAANGFLAGAFDDDPNDAAAGTYYATSPAGTSSSELYVYPLSNPSAATTLTLTTAGSTVAPAIFDWTFAQGYLWGVDKNTGEIARIDAATGDTTSIPQSLLPDATTETYGAAWTFGNGNLGFGNNFTGDVFQLAINNPSGAAPTFSLVSTFAGPASSSNDGASCGNTSADLSLVKTGPSVVAPGAIITYTLTVTNLGAGVSSGFVVDDAVPADITQVATTTPGCSVTGNAVSCAEGTLAVGATFVATITGTAPATSENETNTATVTGDETDPDALNNTSSAGTSICQAATQCAAGDNCGTVSDGCGGMVACGSCATGVACLGNQCQGAVADGGMGTDGGATSDAGTPADGGGIDAGTTVDSGTPEDAGAAVDAGTPGDAGEMAMDASTPEGDAGTSSASDGGASSTRAGGCACGITEAGDSGPSLTWIVSVAATLLGSRRFRRRTAHAAGRE